MKVPFGSDFRYEEDGILFRIDHKNNRIKLYAKIGNRTVILPLKLLRKRRKD